MKLKYSEIKEESTFILTDFKCASSQALLKDRDLYKILWCKEDSAIIKIDGYYQELTMGQVVFCTPLNVLEVDKNNTGLISLVFNREFYCIRDHDQEVSCNGFLFFGSSHHPVITLTDQRKESFDAILHLLKEEFEIKDMIQGEMLRTLLKRLLILSRRLLKHETVPVDIVDSQWDIVRKFNLTVEKNFREYHQVSDYAAMLHRSPKTLTNLFGMYSNRTPLQIINQRILLEAKRLFLFSDKTSQEIAFHLGFKEAGHFSKFFKKNQGVSPTEFRKKNKAK